MRMFVGLDQVAFFIMRHCHPQGLALAEGGYAYIQGVRTGFPNYVEPWAFRLEVVA